MSPGSLRGRVGRLESAPHAPGGCPECGVDPNAPVRYEVIWEDEAEADEHGDPMVSLPPCPRCGHRPVTVLDFDGLITDPEVVKAKREELRRLERERREYMASRPDLTSEARQTLPDYPPEWDEGGGG
jgi:hypothetical protein